MNPAYLIGTGAAVGAVLRHLTGQLVGGLRVFDDRRFPYGTATVNVVGAFVLGLVTALGAPDSVQYLVGTGACGAYTTFSSFSVDVVQLWETGARRLAAWYAASTLAGALGSVWLAFALVG